jgi:hypothetical protein
MIRKIETEEDIERRSSRNKLIIGIFLCAVMVLSTLGFAFMTNERTSSNNQYLKTEQYNGQEFSYDGSYWHATIQGQQFRFQYFPNETDTPKLPPVSTVTFSGQPLYFISENPDATSEISSALTRYLPRLPQEACLVGEPCEGNLPEKSCSTDNIIIIKEANESSVSMQENCIMINGAYADLVKMTDGFLYKVLGVK